MKKEELNHIPEEHLDQVVGGKPEAVPDIADNRISPVTGGIVIPPVGNDK